MRVASRAAGALVLTVTVARAERSHELSRTGPLALGVETASTLALALAMDSASGGAVPERCRWCEPSSFDRWGHDALAGGDRRRLALVSHAGPFVLLPLGALAGVMAPAFSAGRGDHAWQNAWIVVNGFLLTTATASATKQATARRRPVFYFGHEADSEYANSPVEEHLSFFSGDTAWAFDFAASGATLAYLRGYSTAPWLAWGGGAVAVATGALRVASEAHWPTDALAGAAFGAAVGVGVPLLVHPRVDGGGHAVRVSVGRARGATAVTVVGEW